MAQIIMDHGVPGCFGTSSATGSNSNPPSILIGIHATAHTPGMEGNGLKGVEHLAGVEEHEPRAVRIACDRRRRPIRVHLNVDKGMAQGQGGPCSYGRIHQTRQFKNRRQSPAFPAAHVLIGAGSTSIGPGQLGRSARRSAASCPNSG